MGCHGNPLFSWTSGESRANSVPLKFLSLLNCVLRIPLCLALVTLGGCASVSVANVFPKGTGPKKLPAKIYVTKFVAPYDSFHVDREGNDLTAFVASEQLTLAQLIVTQLNKYVAPAEMLQQGKAIPRGNYWLVSGVYDEEIQGSRALRALVGFGVGGTKLQTRVKVSSLTGSDPVDLLSFLTTGGSGIAPGAWASFTPAFVFSWPGAIANAGGASLGGLSMDRKRTAREIAATISEYCFQHGLIQKRRLRRPKKLGELPALQRPDFIIPKSGL